MANTQSLYTELANILHEYDPNLIILKSLREGEDDPDVDSGVNVYCIIRQRRTKNLHVSQGPIVQGSPAASHTIRTYQNKRVVIQFDFYGKTEYDAEDKANACNTYLCERLVASPSQYSFSLFGDVGAVTNNSELVYGKRYKNRFSFQIDLYWVYSLDTSCQCEKMPQKLIITGEAIAK